MKLRHVEGAPQDTSDSASPSILHRALVCKDPLVDKNSCSRLAVTRPCGLRQEHSLTIPAQGAATLRPRGDRS